MPTPIPRRTLQYHLAFLSKAGLIEAKGQARARRYHSPLLEENIATPSSQTFLSIPLSAEALSIQKKIKETFHTRMYVSYNRDFLDSYRPNETFYLSSSIQQKLLTIGTTDG